MTQNTQFWTVPIILQVTLIFESQVPQLFVAVLEDIVAAHPQGLFCVLIEDKLYYREYFVCERFSV